MKREITENNLIDFLKTILEVEGEISLTEFKKRVRTAFDLTEFKKRVRTAFDLSDYDLSVSKTRPGEAMYEQRCRNLNCHRNFPNNLISYENCVFKSR